MSYIIESFESLVRIFIFNMVKGVIGDYMRNNVIILIKIGLVGYLIGDVWGSKWS